MRIEQLYYFLEIAKCRSMSQAAKNLFIRKSTLSNAIHSLENELQQELFVRSSRGVSLTSFGESILQSVEQMIQAGEEIYALSHMGQPPRTDTLTVYSYPVGALSAMAELVQVMHRNHPAVNLSIPQSQSETIVSDLTASAGGIGVVAAGFLTYSYMKRNAENHNLVVDAVYVDALSAFVSRSHPLSTRTAITLEELAQEAVVIYRLFMQPDTNTFYLDFKNLRHCTIVDSYELMKMVIRTGEMIAIAPDLAFPEGFDQSSDVVRIPIADLSVTLTVALVYKQDERQRTALENVALDFLRDYYRRLREKQV